MAARSSGHLRSLTSLRFVAALIVVLHHLPLAVPGAYAAVWFARPGYVGVTFFFVLSGFVLGYNWAPHDRPTDFYVRRAARVYPLHVLSVALIVVIAGLHGGALPWVALPANLMLLHSWSPNTAIAYSFVGAAWSLSCEVFFYAAFPFLARWMSSVRRTRTLAAWLCAGTLAASLAVALVFHESVATYLLHLPVARLGEFAAGVLIAFAVRSGWRPPVRPWMAVALCLAIYGALTALHQFLNPGDHLQWTFSASMAVPFALLIASMACHDLDGRTGAMSTSWAVRLGEWSFALYLLHGPVLSVAQERFHGLVGTSAMFAGMATIAAAVGLSGLAFQLYERPLESRLRRRAVRTGGSASTSKPIAKGPLDSPRATVDADRP